MAYTLPSGMQVRVGVKYEDNHGNPAQVDGAVLWQSSDENIVLATPSGDAPDGYPEDGVCDLQALGPAGTAQITATADADLGSGMKELVTIVTVNVVAGEAVAGVIAPIGEPEPID